MSDIMVVKEYFLKMVGAVICDLPVPECPENVDEKSLYNLCVRNSVQNILSFAMESGAVKLPDEVSARLKQSRLVCGFREASQVDEIDFIRKAFTEKNISFMLLKGSHLKALYPQADMRFMVDMDILVHEEDMPSAKDIILSRGFSQEINNDKDIIFIKKPVLTIELHKTLFAEKDFMHNYFLGVWDKAEKCGEREYKMTYNDLYVYTLAHLAEHYTSAGACFRPMMDLFLLKKHKSEELDFNYIAEQFEVLGIGAFAKNIMSLCEVIFTEKELDEALALMENYIIFGAPVENAKAASAAAISENSKATAFVKTLLPNFKHMSVRYPLLKKLPFLLPLFWVIRVITYTFSKNELIKTKRDQMKNYDKESVEKMKEIFEKSGF